MTTMASPPQQSLPQVTPEPLPSTPPTETDPLLPSSTPDEKSLLSRIPLPTPALRIIALLAAINILVWLISAYPLTKHPSLAAPAALSYVLGLRHALDADHIAAIDLSTRRLIAAGRRPVSVGTFFALGHSTIVVVTCVAVAATGGVLRERFGGAEEVGGLIGGVVSAVVLVVFCVGNGWVLYGLVRKARAYKSAGDGGDDGVEMRGVVGDIKLDDEQTMGFLARTFGRLFNLVDRPWKMFPLGVLFGLGFDTSSEIAILGIASIHAVQGTSIWLILIFPILFACGMALLDTTDGALMSTLYLSPTFARDPLATLYYSLILTAITVVVSAFVAIIQILNLVESVVKPEGPFWDGLDVLSDHFDVVGAAICGLFAVVGVGAVFVYKPWRKRMEARTDEL
ncbi:High-affinity nickel transport protein nic1 [Scedosporium apiospermum]|uniref:Nickel/cobalt efflux system n=1 Tax=Pseudallescheria apiosperma TaxID=563466 RepID=A0A084G5T2_PSEDA|nr:High-affinity nickel transport protein nic1 [Scedosporium apiospermum]KEZ42694.1 High-affinity nickel transport protein nic1 [Scedosporium apiospermum]